MIKALREAAAKVPVPKKDKMASPSSPPTPARVGLSRSEASGFTTLACFYLTTITLLQDISRPTPLLCRIRAPAGRKKLAATSDVLHRRTHADLGGRNTLLHAAIQDLPIRLLLFAVFPFLRPSVG